MNQECQRCALCLDRHCSMQAGFRRISILKIRSIETTEQSIAACPKYRARWAYITRKTNTLPPNLNTQFNQSL